MSKEKTLALHHNRAGERTKRNGHKRAQYKQSNMPTPPHKWKPIH